MDKMSLAIGQQISCAIDSLAFGGEGVGKCDGMVVFVEDALPGEEITLSITQVKKNFARGRLIKIASPSPERVIPPCRYFGRCGGCQLQHLAYPAQVKEKLNQAREIISRIGGLRDLPSIEPVPAPSPYGYRNAVRLHRHLGKSKQYGYYCRDGSNIVSVARCEIASDPINEALPDLSEIANRLGRPDEIILHADADGQIMVCAAGKSAPPIEEELGGVRFRVSPGSFFQANRAVADPLVKYIRALLERCRDRGMLFDLYCGSGIFSTLLGDLFAGSIGIDNDSIAIKNARQNATAEKSRHCQFIRGEAADCFREHYERHAAGGSVIILDPPRRGLGARLCDLLCRTDERAGMLIYVSCNPATLARDLKQLCTEGSWRLRSCAVFDMFPQTAHIEMCCGLERK